MVQQPGAPGFSHTGRMPKQKQSAAKRGLSILFKEVIEGVPENQASKLMDAYRQGTNIAVIIGESSFGKDRKTAFRFLTSKDQSWRDLPEPAPGVH